MGAWPESINGQRVPYEQSLEELTVIATGPAPGRWPAFYAIGRIATERALDLLFASDGHAVKASTLEPLGRYGGTTIANYSNVAPVPDPDGTNIWFLDPSNMALLDFDRTTFELRRTIALGPLVADYDLANASPLVKWSPTGFAFRTYEHLFLVTLSN